MEPKWGNPVDGVIQSPTATWDHVSFIVTKTFAQHEPGGLGMDIGNGACTGLVRAMADGKVVERQDPPNPNAPKIVRIKHGDTGFSTGYAHMSSISVGLGADVRRGDRIGIVGNTGAVLCHLHFDISQGNNRLDPWPRLEQNQEADMETTIVMYPTPRTWHTKGGTLTGRRLAPAPLTQSMTFEAASPAEADSEFTINPAPAGWPGGPYLRVITGGMAGFLVAFSEVDPGSAPPSVALLIDAATAPLKAEIARLTQQLAEVRRQLASLTGGPPDDGGP